jgi:hypothetical protein
MKTKIKVHLMWAVHNLIAHPVGELFYWIGLGRYANWFHDATIPKVSEAQGVRGTTKGFWK